MPVPTAPQRVEQGLCEGTDPSRGRGMGAGLDGRCRPRPMVQRRAPRSAKCCCRHSPWLENITRRRRSSAAHLCPWPGMGEGRPHRLQQSVVGLLDDGNPAAWTAEDRVSHLPGEGGRDGLNVNAVQQEYRGWPTPTPSSWRAT